MNLQQAALIKRSKELDAQQEFIDKQRKILEDAPINLNVYEAQVTAKEHQLTKIQENIDIKTQEYAAIETDKVEVIRRLDKRVRELEIKKLELDTISKDRIRSIDESQVTFDRIKREIADRQNYQIEQENNIEQGMAQGNEALLDIKDAIAESELILNTIKHDTIEADSKLNDLLIANNNAESDHKAKMNDYAAKERLAHEQLAEVQTKLADSSKKHSDIVIATDNKLAQLKEKEESLVAKHDANVLEKQQIDRQTRQYQATRSLYGD